MKLKYQGSDLQAQSTAGHGGDLDFQLDQQGYVAIILAGKPVGHVVYTDNKQLIFSNTHKTQFRAVPKSSGLQASSLQTSNLQDPSLPSSATPAQANRQLQSELEYDDQYYLIPVATPWYYRRSNWYWLIPLIIFFLFLVLCIVVWQVAYNHGQRWFLQTVNGGSGDDGGNGGAVAITS